ncbi:hypothetical protein [Microbacterium hominis]|uniref:hypothetical protein n=1 Tax=Microbacterium hominis TaxID=162426 RepID=UPI001CC2CC8A|nr:hypothetical protein [Microbacterium hominis]
MRRLAGAAGAPPAASDAPLAADCPPGADTEASAGAGGTAARRRYSSPSCQGAVSTAASRASLT